MKNQLMTFKSHELGISLNGMLYQGKPVFVAVDLAESLGYADPHGALTKHCKSLIKLDSAETGELGLGFRPKGIILALESDAYRLIMRSHLPSAERVQDWVCEEVLPSIRETGSYGHQPKPMSEMEMIAAMAADAVRQQNRLIHIEDKVAEVTDLLDDISRGATPSGWAGYSELKAQCGLSDTKCRQLVAAYDIDHKPIPFIAPGGTKSTMTIVRELPFMTAFRKLMHEAEPRGTRWYHSKMGIFQVIGWEK
ncbi:hypothetical protein EKN56_12755 [Limnobaculum zhutongyuii]|uniref:Bro-N domain-containing protein n=1 Tax=Limnobaculum zhutongyuii TaxID=2498113 RepID=A0A411WM11_9GAMM|nr:BRO family protein [Limnobaculum zhutongyuii]QBH97186.1 hypothetical protein EKN56_12755 [Limnobaculum zhutongyuii]TQS88445.1 hypothetical protein ELQ32_10540 [Limnobaculum zhutongyuii]